MYRHFLDLINLDFWCPHFFVSANVTVGHRFIHHRSRRQAITACQIYYKYLHLVMSDALRRGLGYY